jgi:hypothetical protein
MNSTQHFVNSADRFAIKSFLQVHASRLRHDRVTVSNLITRWERVTGAEAREEVYEEARLLVQAFKDV